MRSRQWSWVGACSTGSSHIRAGTVCQDSATCIEVPVDGDSVLVAVVSDGAGSATLSSIGSRLVVDGFVRRATSDLRMGLTPNKLSEEIVRDWLDDIREHIFHTARQRATTPRQLAATLVGALIYSEGAVVCHVGDGACVVRKNGSLSWEVPSRPAHGEYASSTYFVTDDPEPRLQFVQVADAISELAIFSDGIERLALDFANKTASERFFDPMFAPLAHSGPGRNRTLSSSLRKYLDSPRIVDRTDDDKSLILARRVG